MRKKDELAIDKIIECAKREFSEKSFEGASMRRVAENAGYTTGMLYGRFADKGELFKAIVSGVADGFISFFTKAQSDFALLTPEDQYKNMHGYVDKKVEEMLGIVYDNFDVFKLIICKSKGSEYEKFVDKLIEIETENTMRFIGELSAGGDKNQRRSRGFISHARDGYDKRNVRGRRTPISRKRTPLNTLKICNVSLTRAGIVC